MENERFEDEFEDGEFEDEEDFFGDIDAAADGAMVAGNDKKISPFAIAGAVLFGAAVLGGAGFLTYNAISKKRKRKEEECDDISSYSYY